jgi:hypothetical protein
MKEGRVKRCIAEWPRKLNLTGLTYCKIWIFLFKKSIFSQKLIFCQMLIFWQKLIFLHIFFVQFILFANFDIFVKCDFFLQNRLDYLIRILRCGVSQKVTHKASSTSEIRKVKKCTFFFNYVFFFDKSNFSHTI